MPATSRPCPDPCPDPSRGLTGSPTGLDILFLALSAATLLAAALTLGGLLAGPFG